LSQLIEQYLKSLIAPACEINEENSPLIQLKGSFSEPNVSDTEILIGALNEKYKP